MARKSKIRFEWDFNYPGLLRAIRDRGKITYDELLEAINGSDVDFQGHVVHDVLCCGSGAPGSCRLDG